MHEIVLLAGHFIIGRLKAMGVVGIICFKMEGLQLDEAVLRLLMDQAYELTCARKAKKSFKEGDFQGTISTAGKKAALGDVSGTIFSAIVEHGGGQTHVEFIGDMVLYMELQKKQNPPVILLENSCMELADLHESVLDEKEGGLTVIPKGPLFLYRNLIAKISRHI